MVQEMGIEIGIKTKISVKKAKNWCKKNWCKK